MRRFGLLIAIALALAVVAIEGLAAGGRASHSQAQLLAIHGGRLFDGTGAPPIEDGVVVIEGDRIVAAGPADEVDIPAGAATIDAEGGLIMPGVIDNHVHIGAGWTLERLDDHLTPWLEAGVTTLVDVGFVRDGAVLGGVTIEDGIGLLRTLVEGVAEHPPRVFAAGPLLTAPGGYPATRGDEFSTLSAQPVTGPDDARERVANLIEKRGADLIKVAIEAGFGVDYNEPGWPVLDAETLAAIAEETHEHGKMVRAHVTETNELDAAIDAGFDVAAHTPIEPLLGGVLQQALAIDMIFVSTANIWGPEGSQNAAENAARYTEMGGRVALGTDYPFQAGSEMPVKEMQLLVDAGMTPAEVLVAATKHGAEALGLGDELGTLAPGKLADVIVVDGDPLSDIADMADVRVVVRDGEVIVGDVVQPAATAPGSPVPTATPVALPETGSGSADGNPYVWPAVAVLLAAAVVVSGAIVVVRRR